MRCPAPRERPCRRASLVLVAAALFVAGATGCASQPRPRPSREPAPTVAEKPRALRSAEAYRAVLKGEAALSRGDTGAAYAAFRAARLFDPQSPELARMAGEAALRAGEAEAAEAACRDAYRVAPSPQAAACVAGALAALEGEVEPWAAEVTASLGVVPAVHEAAIIAAATRGDRTAAETLGDALAGVVPPAAAAGTVIRALLDAGDLEEAAAYATRKQDLLSAASAMEAVPFIESAWAVAADARAWRWVSAVFDPLAAPARFGAVGMQAAWLAGDTDAAARLADEWLAESPSHPTALRMLHAMRAVGAGAFAPTFRTLLDAHSVDTPAARSALVGALALVAPRPRRARAAESCARKPSGTLWMPSTCLSAAVRFARPAWLEKDSADELERAVRGALLGAASTDALPPAWRPVFGGPGSPGAAVPVAPDAPVAAHLDAASRALAAGDAQAAVPHAERALAYAADEQRADAQNLLAYAYAEAGIALQDAAELAARAHGRGVLSAGILDTRAWVALKRGRLDDAARFIARAARLAPDNAEIRAHAARIAQARGEPHVEQARLARALCGVDVACKAAVARALAESGASGTEGEDR